MNSDRKKIYFASDQHFGIPDAERSKLREKKFISWLDEVKVDAKAIFLLGDLFDFWFEYKHAIPKDQHEVLFMLSDLINQGIPIDYISGNHDFWMGDFFTDEIGVTIHKDYFDFEYNNLKLHLIHGDGLAKADGGYRFLKKILRNRFNIWLYKKLPPDWAIPLAKKV